ncbi:MAG: bifunctional phosphopantothenoylcysteine decarboxylase/phosphopantothenate--cysteine ligase CoaBC [Clostridiales bacterium]|nr:bifunctional phosphopantothenoylcysteine decarboxylase/phosphopantothenate--cysteine ligase CoaBC [Clostridiales bacterium]
MNLKGKNVVIGVTGGIAVYKMCEVVSSLRKRGADVFVVMTKNATEFVSPLTFETLSNNRVVTDMFDRDREWEVEHISLAKKADIFVVAPATANFVGKFASGIADDFLTTTVMATKAPILLAPAMNTGMMTSPAYEKNESELKARGVNFIYGDSGFLACGDTGKGRLADPKSIVEAIEEILFPVRDLEGKTVMVTAGATREPVDPVRFITNRSSGKMGIAIANSALKRGANVLLIKGFTTVNPDEGVEVINVETTAQMYDAVMNNLDKADIIIKSAAPADYRVKTADQKIKSETLTLEFIKNPDIAQAVGKVKGNKKLVVFSAETENLFENATKKLIKKNADMVVANDVTKQGAGFDVDTNIASFITKDGVDELPIMTKTELADKILDKVQSI